MATITALDTLSSPITNEEFTVFHRIDLVLYATLIFTLGRDPTDSIWVMAFFLWLERNKTKCHLVNRMLSMKPLLVKSIAEEAVVCFKCIESDGFLFDPQRNDIPLLRGLVGHVLSLQYLHENRVSILRGVTDIANDVCSRSFRDIINNALGKIKRGNVVEPAPFMATTTSQQRLFEEVGRVPNQRVQLGVEVQRYNINSITNDEHCQNLNEEVGEALGNLRLQGGVVEQENEVPADDRTIFLTFSKGYPISENEVRNFFTRKHGEIFEAIKMQEVTGGEQALYARMVVKLGMKIRGVLRGQRKVRFNINGKHVWARKYVKKHPKSPFTPTTTSAPPPSSSRPPMPRP